MHNINIIYNNQTGVQHLQVYYALTLAFSRKLQIL